VSEGSGLSRVDAVDPVDPRRSRTPSDLLVDAGTPPAQPGRTPSDLLVDAGTPDFGPVVVIGASGKTGRAVSAALRASGVAVRAAVRPGREHAAPPGTAAVVVDLESGHGLERALDGAQAAYHLAPNVHPDEVGIARRVAAAASTTDLARLVFHSVLQPEDARMPHHLRKAEAELLLRRRFPGDLVVLRPAAYHQNLLGHALGGTITVPYSADSPFTTVDLDDVAEVAGAVLLARGVDGGVHDLAGPEVLTTRAMADQAASVLGRAVEVRETTIRAWLLGPGARLPDSARDALAAMFAAYDEDGLIGDPSELTSLLGRPPTPWADAVRRAAGEPPPPQGDATPGGKIPPWTTPAG
jgi:NAD(P)H dehydrogenase (quinone)